MKSIFFRHPRSLLSAGLLGLLVLGASGCASSVSSLRGSDNLRMTSEPPGAKISVYRVDAKTSAATLLFTQTTPCALPLKPAAGYFKGQPYRLDIELAGYAPASVEIKPKVSGWYWGNLAGGVVAPVGLFTDSATGAMWNLSAESIAPQPGSAEAELIKSGNDFVVKLAPL